ncbi:SurA N-terminal domain-containing protein [Bacillus haikouensis]|nr:SurA N-terminal domain-containing protein [Bacillus haikouensis]
MGKLLMVMILIILLLVGCGTGEKGNAAAGLDEYLTEKRIEKRVGSLQKTGSGGTHVRIQAIEQLIDEYILKAEAESQGLSVSYREIQETIEFQIGTAKKVQNKRFENDLKALNLSIEEYYQDYAYSSIKGKLLENKLYDKVTVEAETPEQEVEKWNEYKNELIKDFRNKNDAKIENVIDGLK